MTANKPEVKRFDCTSGGAQHCYGCYTMKETELGDYVEWEAYEALQAERDTLLDLLERSSEWVYPPDKGCRCDTCREALALTDAIGVIIRKKVNDNQ